MDPKIAKKTQDTLGKIIKKPPLTDKLLAKPPFRFLHDILTSVIKTTGFMKGVFADTELNSENVKDRDSKVAFLQKGIDFVAFVTGKTVDVKPAKIVAGHEPERTNEFLQSLASAVNKQVDNDSYVKKFLNKDSGKAPKDEPKREKEREKSKDRSDDRRKKDSEDKGDREKSKDRERSKDRDHRESSRDRERGKGREDRDKRDRDDREKKDRDDREKRDRHREDRHDREKKDTEEKEDRHKDRDRRSRRHRDEGGKENETPAADMMNGEREGRSEDKPARIPRPSSAKGKRRHHEGRGDESSDEEDEIAVPRGGRHLAPSEPSVGEDDLPPQVSEARRLARPSSARPAPPRVKQEGAEAEPAMRLGSGKPTNVIVDDDGDEDEDETFVVEDTAPPPPEPEQDAIKPEDDEDADHGGLVKRILETKKELQHGSQQQTGQSRKTEIERPTLSDAQRRKQREVVQKEIDKLRGSIQTLTRSANPLGKIMDYVQEDLDAMQKEVERWKQENKQHALALKREKGITEQAVEPLKAQLGEVDQAIKDQLDMIAAVKSNIIRNDAKIDKMLRSIAKS